MGSNLLCNKMKINTANFTYNPCSYVSSRKYHVKIPSSFKSITCSYRKTFTCRHLPEKREQLLEEHKVIRKGDKVNLHDLVFTEYRDHVVRYKDNIEVQVKAAQLAGKVIVLYFLPLHHDYVYSRKSISYLIDTYTYLLSDNVLEVVLVAYGTADGELLSDSYEENQSSFESIFRHMPWTAIPFTDSTSRECLVRRFGIDRLKCYSTSIVIDSSGMVLQSDSCKLFRIYGGLGYPFSDKMISSLQAQDAATAKKPSLKALLGSPKRDFVISNKGNKVLIDTLEGKLVALYFYEEDITPESLTTNIKKAYKEVAKNNIFFEVVLIYVYTTTGTIDYTSEESFQNTFETMPWLALPFRDPKCESLMRFFGFFPDSHGLQLPKPLVIIEPLGQPIEPQAANIICKLKLPAYLFTERGADKLDPKNLQNLLPGGRLLEEML